MSQTKNKLAFGLLNLLFLGLSIGAGVTLIRQSQEVRSRALAQPAINLKIDTPEAHLGNRIAVVVEIDSVNTPIGFIDLELKFNPHLLRAVNLEPGPFFKDPKIHRLNYDNDTGTVTISLSPNQKETLSSGLGDLAIIVFEAVAPGATNLLASKTHVAINADTPSLIQSVPPANLTITE